MSEDKKTNINIEKLRADKLKSLDVDLMSVEIEERRRKREETKKAIIEKINSDNKQKELEETQRLQKLEIKSSVKKQNVDEVLKESKKKKKSHPQINILPIKSKHKNKIKDNSERLSYTMQMDIFSKEKLDKARKQRKNLNVEDKFTPLESTISKLYIIIVSGILALIVINYIVLLLINK